MKKWMGMLLGVVILAAVPAVEKIDVLAAPVEAGVTTLSDAAYIDQEWAEKKISDLLCRKCLGETDR